VSEAPLICMSSASAMATLKPPLAEAVEKKTAWFPGGGVPMYLAGWDGNPGGCVAQLREVLHSAYFTIDLLLRTWFQCRSLWRARYSAKGRSGKRG